MLRVKREERSRRGSLVNFPSSSQIIAQNRKIHAVRIGERERKRICNSAVVFFFLFSFRLHVKCKITVAVILIALTKESGHRKKTDEEKKIRHTDTFSLRQRRRGKNNDDL